MRIEMTHRGYATHEYKVTLETDQEREWTDGRLITTVDRSGLLTDEGWAEIQSGNAHPGHFGGNVVRNGDVCIVRVYVD